MTEERTTPLRERMIEDMRIRGLGDKSRQAHIRALKDFAAFLGHAPDTATPEEFRAYQLHMTDAEVSPSVYNARITALRFFFSMTCGRAWTCNASVFIPRRMSVTPPAIQTFTPGGNAIMARPPLTESGQALLYPRPTAR